MQLQPEIKMTDMKSETIEPDIAHKMYVKFQRNPHIFSIEHYSVSNVSTVHFQGGWTIKDGGRKPEIDMK